jgi:predicted metalloprotease
VAAVRLVGASVASRSPIGGGKIGLIVTIVIVWPWSARRRPLRHGTARRQRRRPEGRQHVNLEQAVREEQPKTASRTSTAATWLYMNLDPGLLERRPAHVLQRAVPGRSSTNFFYGSINTGCGQADSGVGPFYCPADRQVYIDLTFYNELSNRFGAKGEFAAPVRARARVRPPRAEPARHRRKGPAGRQAAPTSGSVRLELQADCFAGCGRSTRRDQGPRRATPSCSSRSPPRTSRRRSRRPGAIGDDTIQKQSGGQVEPRPLHPRHVGPAQAVVQHGLQLRRPHEVRHLLGDPPLRPR